MNNLKLTLTTKAIQRLTFAVFSKSQDKELIETHNLEGLRDNGGRLSMDFTFAQQDRDTDVRVEDQNGCVVYTTKELSLEPKYPIMSPNEIEDYYIEDVEDEKGDAIAFMSPVDTCVSDNAVSVGIANAWRKLMLNQIISYQFAYNAIQDALHYQLQKQGLTDDDDLCVIITNCDYSDCLGEVSFNIPLEDNDHFDPSKLSIIGYTGDSDAATVFSECINNRLASMNAIIYDNKIYYVSGCRYNIDNKHDLSDISFDLADMTFEPLDEEDLGVNTRPEDAKPTDKIPDTVQADIYKLQKAEADMLSKCADYEKNYYEAAFCKLYSNAYNNALEECQRRYSTLMAYNTAPNITKYGDHAEASMNECKGRVILLWAGVRRIASWTGDCEMERNNLRKQLDKVKMLSPKTENLCKIINDLNAFLGRFEISEIKPEEKTNVVDTPRVEPVKSEIPRKQSAPVAQMRDVLGNLANDFKKDITESIKDLEIDKKIKDLDIESKVKELDLGNKAKKLFSSFFKKK